MEPANNTIGRSGIPLKVCPVTGLNITSRAEWTDIEFSLKYKETLFLVGDNILYSRPSGYAELEPLAKVMNMTSSIAATHFGDTPYVQIEDYSSLEGTSTDARKYFIDAMKKRKGLKCLIFCSTSPFFSMSIKLAKRLNIVAFNVDNVPGYTEALELAVKLLAEEGEDVEESSGGVSDSGGVRRVKGLPVTGRPEWAKVELGGACFASFRLIGSRILWIAANGTFDENALRVLTEKRTEIVNAMIGSTEPFFEIRDSSNIKKNPLLVSKDVLVNSLFEEQERLLGFIGFNAPDWIEEYAEAKISTYDRKFLLGFVEDSKTATAKAIEALKLSDLPEDAGSSENGQPDNLRHYVDELLFFLGNFRLGEETARDLIFEPGPNHPFKPVFEAVKLAKADVDLLLEEKTRAAMDSMESIERLGFLLDNAKDFIYEYGGDGVFTYANTAMLEVFGYSAEEFRAMKMADIMEPQNFSNAFKDADDRIKGRVPSEKAYEIKCITREGKTIWVETRLHIVFENGVVAYIQGIARDITEKRNLQGGAFETVLEGVGPVIILDREEKTKYFNEAFAQKFGWALSEVQGKKLSFTPPENAGLDTPLMARAWAGERVTGSKTRRFSKEGQLFDMIADMGPIVEQDGEISGVAITFTDVSDTADAIRELTQSVNRYRSAVQNMAEGYFELDLAGMFLFINNGLETMTGYSRKEIIGKDYRDYTSLEGAEVVYRAYQKVLTTGKGVSGVKGALIPKDGPEIPVELMVSRINDNHGKAIGFRGFVRDLKDAKKEEKKQGEKVEAESKAMQNRIETLEKNESVFNELSGGSFEIDITGTITWADNGLATLTGFSGARGLVGKDIIEVLMDGTGESFSMAMNTAFKEPGSHVKTKILLTETRGETREVEVRLTCKTGQSGKRTGFAGIVLPE